MYARADLSNITNKILRKIVTYIKLIIEKAQTEI